MAMVASLAASGCDTVGYMVNGLAMSRNEAVFRYLARITTRPDLVQRTNR